MTANATEAVGVTAISIMVSSYALERRHRIFIAIFAAGCALAAEIPAPFGVSADRVPALVKQPVMTRAYAWRRYLRSMRSPRALAPSMTRPNAISASGQPNESAKCSAVKYPV